MFATLKHVLKLKNVVTFLKVTKCDFITKFYALGNKILALKIVSSRKNFDDIVDVSCGKTAVMTQVAVKTN